MEGGGYAARVGSFVWPYFNRRRQDGRVHPEGCTGDSARACIAAFCVLRGWHNSFVLNPS